MAWINIIFHFSVFLFFGKNGKIEKWSRTRRFFYFSHFSNNIKKIKIAKYRFSPFTVFFVFLKRTSKLEKRKNDQFSWPFSFFVFFFCTLKYANMIRISNISFFPFFWKNGKLDWPKCARTVSCLATGWKMSRTNFSVIEKIFTNFDDCE